MKELLEAANDKGFKVTLFASRQGITMYVVHTISRATLRVFEGPDFDLMCSDAIEFIETAAVCS